MKTLTFFLLMSPCAIAQDFYCRPITPVVHTTVQVVQHKDGGSTVFYTSYNAAGVAISQQSVYTFPVAPRKAEPAKQTFGSTFSWDRFASGKPLK